MQSRKIQTLLRRYFFFSGLEEKFGSLDLTSQLDGFLHKITNDEDDKETNDLKAIMDVVASWDGEFDSLVTVEAELEKLTVKLLPFDWSQDRILQNWPQFCKLTGIATSDRYARGVCGALSRLSELSLILTQDDLDRLPENLHARLVNFEDYLKCMAAWDGKDIKEVREDFKAFEAMVLPMQDDLCNWQFTLQDCPLNVGPSFSFSFVYNSETLIYFFRTILKPGKVIYLGASDHAARLFVTIDNKIVYYNPNERYGYLTFDLENLSPFLYKLAQGFRNVSVQKFSLTVDVYDAQGFRPYPLKFKKIFNKLLHKQKAGHLPIKLVVNNQGMNGETALYMAAYENNLKQVSLLIKLGADPNLCELTRTAPLHIAAMRGNLEITRLFLSVNNIKIDCLDNKARTPLAWALSLNRFAVAKALFAAGADINHLTMPLRWKMFDYLLTQDIPTDKVSSLCSFDKALQRGDLVINLKDENFIDFLENIVRDDDVAVLKVLIKHQPEIMGLMFSLNEPEESEENKKGKEIENDLVGSILHLALAYESVRSIKCLLKYNPALSKKVDSQGCSAKEWAASRYDMEDNNAILDIFVRYENAVPSVLKQSIFTPAQGAQPKQIEQPSRFSYCLLY